MKVIRKRLSEIEVTGTTTTRWDVACVCFQTFDPFTQTWYENPAADPRTNTIYLLPPRTVGDIRCDSAANMRAKLETMLDQFFVTVEIAQLINAILGVVLVFQPGGGLLVALIIAFVEAIVEIGVAAILFDFTPPEVWDGIQCALYQEMQPDGTITAEGLALAQEKIDLIDSGSTIGPVIAAMFLLLGVVGMNNAGSTGDETGDCSECPLFWCHKYDFADSTPQGWNSFANPVTNGMDSAGWVSANTSGGTYLNIEIEFDPPVKLTSIAFSFGVSDSYTSVGSGTWITAVVDGVDTNLTGGYAYPPPGISSVGWTGSVDEVTRVRLNSQINATITTHCYYAQLSGEGVNPAEDDNC